MKEKFIPHRAKRTLNSERNRDYVVVDEPGLDHICTAQDLIYQPEAMQVQYSIGPMINHQSCDVAALIDMQSTRSGVECVEEPEEMVENQRDSFLAPSSMSISTGSSTASSTMSSTNSSNNEFSGIDRSILDETEYSSYFIEKVSSNEEKLENYFSSCPTNRSRTHHNARNNF